MSYIHFHLLTFYLPDYKLLKGRGHTCTLSPLPLLPHTVLEKVVIKWVVWSQTDMSLNHCSATYQLYDFGQI